jgi:pilus assembly protein FimV
MAKPKAKGKKAAKSAAKKKVAAKKKKVAPKKPVAKKPPQRKNQEPTPIVVPEKSFVDQLLDNPLLKNPLLLGGGLLVFVLLVIFIIHRRRGGGGFQESILMGGTSSMIKAKGEAKSSEEASFFSDFAVSGMGSIHAEDSEVDPLTEADTYMAYQKYDLAEESLREAIRHHDRPELRAKLLEVFHASKNEAAFESEAIRLHQMVNGRGSLWNKAVALGSEIIPNHALFSGSGGKFVGSHGDARLDNEVLDIGLDLDALTAQPESSQGSGGFDVDLGVDFSDISEIEEKKPAQKAPAPVMQASAPATEEFDLGDLDMNFEESTAGMGSTSADESMSLDSDVSLDFGDLDLGHDASDATPGFQSQSNDLELGYGNDIELGDIDLSDMDLNPASESHSSMGDTMDLGDLNDFQLDAPAEGDALFADLDETGTKLDLARAYVEMGDADGARSILDEVIHEGSSAQKQQAQQLLQQIA